MAAPGEDPYAAAADKLASWQRRGILVRDPEPMAYVLRTTSTFEDGRALSRTGVYLAVAALPFGERLAKLEVKIERFDIAHFHKGWKGLFLDMLSAR